MSRLEKRNIDSPDEIRPFQAHGHADVVTLGDFTIGRGVYEPGWKWSNDVKPLAKTPSCQFRYTGVFLADPRPGQFRHHDAHFDIRGQFNVPRSPQGRPVIFQAGDSDEGREFAASSADAIFSRYSTLEAGQAFYADVKGRLARHGRTPDQLLILPAATFSRPECRASYCAFSPGSLRSPI